jgi:hypothetical protein
MKYEYCCISIGLHDNTPFSGIQKKAYNLLSILNVLVLNITLRQVIVDPTPSVKLLDIELAYIFRLLKALIGNSV